MCRLLGIVSSETTSFRFSLADAPRSLATLSKEHPHGWGLAVHSREHGAWQVRKQAVCAGEDARFAELAARARGEVLVAHIRKATVGGHRTENTHPFERGSWVFAHNGTIEDIDFLRHHTSETRAREVQGETDSERMFAYLLTAIDAAPSGAIDGAIARALSIIARRDRFGSASYLLSNGRSLWAHRRQRTLFRLHRGQGDEVVSVRTSKETTAQVETPWSERRRAILLASERLSEEPWQEVPEGALLRIDHGSDPRVAEIEV